MGEHRPRVVQEEAVAFVVREGAMQNGDDQSEHYWGHDVAQQDLDRRHEQDEAVLRKPDEVVAQNNKAGVVEGGYGMKACEPNRVNVTHSKKRISLVIARQINCKDRKSAQLNEEPIPKHNLYDVSEREMLSEVMNLVLVLNITPDHLVEVSQPNEGRDQGE